VVDAVALVEGADPVPGGALHQPGRRCGEVHGPDHLALLGDLKLGGRHEIGVLQGRQRSLQKQGVPLVVILEKAKVVASAAARRSIERRCYRFTSALDELDPKPLGKSCRNAGAGARVDANHDLKRDPIGRGLGADRRNCLLEKKPSRLLGIRERLEQRRDYDGDRCQSRPPGYPDGPDR